MMDFGEQLTVLLPHPDDEFAIFPWLEQALTQGVDVRCIWLTDGGWGGQDVFSRQNESQKVLSKLGLPVSAMHFLGSQIGVADGSLYLELLRVTDALSRNFPLKRTGTVLIPAWEGGHQDHDAGHLIGHRYASRADVEVWQYSLYNGAGLPGPFFRVLSALPTSGLSEYADVNFSARVRYISMCTGFRSQWKSFLGLLPFYIAKMFRRRAFSLQKLVVRLPEKPPHAGRLLYERRGGPSWSEFSRELDIYRSSESSQNVRHAASGESSS